MVKHFCTLEWANISQDEDTVCCYGPAFDACEENDEGQFWIDNGEYGSRVNYCPICGAKAPKQIKIIASEPNLDGAI